MSSGQGQALLAGGRFHEAVAVFQQILRQQPESVPARVGLARALAGTGDTLSAIAWLSDAQRRAPEQLEPLQLLADALLLRQEYAQALPPYEQLLARAGGRTAGNLLHAGFCAEHAGDVEQAVQRYQEAVQVDPALMEAHVDLAGTLWRLEDFDGALRHARQAVALAPSNPHARRILGTALLQLNRLPEAEQHLRAALQAQPDFPLAQLDLSFVLLLAGRLREGWPLYEHRWRDGRLQRPGFFSAQHEWAGPSEPLQGRAIAVYAEQGWGDVLQMLRYLPRLQALGAEVCCVVGAPLVPLVEASFPGVECLRPGRSLQVQSHVAFMELPGRFGTDLRTIPADVPYLQVPEEARQRWRDRLRPWDTARKVGFAWSGSQVQVNNRNRAVPLGVLLPLARTPGVQGFSLQQGDGGPWTDVPVAGSGLVDFTPEWSDFVESAAMLMELDLVVTVDTAVAHLAGALGKPVWLLLGPNPDWRWLLEREDSPWYPTMRLFRRGAGEDRGVQVARVQAALQEWLREA